MTRAPACALCALFALSVMVAAEGASRPSQTPPRRGGNPGAAKLKNPVESTPESVAAGRQTYTRLCARCHGATGKGDGGGAGAGGQPADLTDDMWDFGGTDGEIFGVIHDGTSADMEGYAERISDTDIWQLINYIRSLHASPAR